MSGEKAGGGGAEALAPRWPHMRERITGRRPTAKLKRAVSVPDDPRVDAGRDVVQIREVIEARRLRYYRGRTRPS
jgi:hypothetical protein